jgi:NTP pyrophosphatase (non-canonical NTP hydrolase)
MDFNKYQKLAKKTAVYPNSGKNFIYPTIGLMGEAGELANKIKKVIRDDGSKITKEKREEIKAEMGDILWYVSQLATELKLELSDVAKYNIEKLSKRQKENKLHGSGDNR